MLRSALVSSSIVRHRPTGDARLAAETDDKKKTDRNDKSKRLMDEHGTELTPLGETQVISRLLGRHTTSVTLSHEATDEDYRRWPKNGGYYESPTSLSTTRAL
jgi:hypothetical protein